MLQSRKDQVKAKVNEIFDVVKTQYGMDLSDTIIRFDLTGRVAGTATKRGNELILRFNTTMMMNEGWDHILNDTVSHEIAHLCCFLNPCLGNAHNNGWKQVCRKLGGNGQRCHSNKVVYAKGNTYQYVSTTGQLKNVSQKIHNKIQHGATYTWRNGGGSVTKDCQHQLIAISGRELNTAPIITPEVIPVIVTNEKIEKTNTRTKITATIEKVKPDTTGKVTKADQVRNRIRIAKQNGEPQAAVAEWAENWLGMKRQLAKVYARNLWDQV